MKKIKQSMPMKINYKETELYRLLQKEVLDSKTIDLTEEADWQVNGQAEISFTTDLTKDGEKAVQMTAPFRGGKQTGEPGVGSLGYAEIVRLFDREDWSDYNRVSFWVYTEAPGHNYVNILNKISNADNEDEPEETMQGKKRNHFTIVNTGEWTQVVWEIPDLPRDKIIKLNFGYEMRGKKFPHASDHLTFTIDNLKVEKVKADHIEGWNIAPGKISFSHTGYVVDSTKQALATDLEKDTFSIIDTVSDEVVYEGSVETIKKTTGKFQLMDFTDFKKPGTYQLKTGDRKTRQFKIGNDIWQQILWKNINFFYCMRCGYEVPGSHARCHDDFFCEHQGKKIRVNGGWHDAADLTQLKGNTAEAVYAMFRLLERLQEEQADKNLIDRLIEEAVWGLDWLRYTDFRNGWRQGGAAHRFWSNGKTGDYDDVIKKARKSSKTGFLCVEAETAAARVLQDIDPDRAADCRKLAYQTFNFICEDFNIKEAGLSKASYATTAAIELYDLTGEKKYADKAVVYADYILACQARKIKKEFSYPITGYFYNNTDKKDLYISGHFGIEYKPVVALSRLCEVLPDHENWIKWYSAVVIHSEYYLKQLSKFTEPFKHPVNSLMKVENPQENSVAAAGDDYKIGDKWYVKPFQNRGNNATSLASIKSLSAAARLRNKPELGQLSTEQLYWYLGLNPFCKSLVYGEGYDWSTFYNYDGDIIGSMAVGIRSLNGYEPYWPVTNTWIFREVWMHPVYLWMWIMQDLWKPLKHGNKFKIEKQINKDDQLEILLEVSNSGDIKKFNLEYYNLELKEEKDYNLQHIWKVKIKDLSKPWVAVVIPDGKKHKSFDISGNLF